MIEDDVIPTVVDTVKKTKKTESKEIPVTLLKAHRHAGLDYQAGDVIMVDKASADFIIVNNVGVQA